MSDHLSPSERVIVDATRRHLASGALPTEVLVERLAAEGAAATLEVPADELGDAIIAALLETDGIWLTSDAATVLDIAPRLDTAVFTHRLTEAERASGEVVLHPDLVLLHRGLDEATLTLPDGAEVRIVPDDLLVPGEERTLLAGPAGWLDAFTAGDAIAFSRRGDALTLAPAAARPGSGGRETDLLREAHAALAEGHRSAVWLFPLLLEVLATNDHAFRAPVRPVSELLADAGFSIQLGRVGVAGADFLEEARREDVAELVIDLFRLEECCLDAFETVCEAFHEHAAGTPVEPTRDLAAALAHDQTAPALVAYVEAWTEEDGPVVLADFATPFATLEGRHRAGGAFLMSVITERIGEIDTAIALAEAAVVADPGFDSAIEHLARLLAITGNVDTPIKLHQQLDYEEDPELAFLLTMRVTRRTDVGRNDPCPCGSGRKYKACHMNQPPERPAWQHARWLRHKLAWHTLGPPNNGRLVALALQVFSGEPGLQQRITLVDQFIGSGIPVDWVLYDDRVAEEFAARYDAALPAAEREMLADWIDRPLTLFEVEQLARGGILTLRDVRTGATADVPASTVGQDCTVGDLLLGRIGMVGDAHLPITELIEVDEQFRERTLALVESVPDAPAVAAWYASLAVPR